MLALFTVCGIVPLTQNSSLAQSQTFPIRPIKVVVQFPSGSATDIGIRVMTDRMMGRLGQTVLVESRPGAGGAIATNYVKSQAPDGYTLLVSSSTMSITSALPNPPYDIRRDLTHIVPTIGGPLVIAISTAKLPNVRTLKDLIDYAKANPGTVNFGSYGTGSTAHLAIELFNQLADVNTVHIPYKGSAASILALASGDSHATLDVMLSLAPQIQAGKARAIVTTSPQRSALMPDLPAMVESGLPAYNVTFWQGISAPVGLPKDIVGKLNAVVNASMQDQAVQDWAKRTQSQIVGGTSDALTETVNREVATWEKLIRDRKIQIE